MFEFLYKILLDKKCIDLILNLIKFEVSQVSRKHIYPQILSKASKDRLEILHGDILHFNMEPFIPEVHKSDWFSGPPNIHLIGNLPFSVASPLIIQWLENISCQSNAWSSGRVPMTLTFQKEVI